LKGLDLHIQVGALRIIHGLQVLIQSKIISSSFDEGQLKLMAA